MVNTRSRFNRANRIEQSGVDRYSDEDDEMSVADHYTENNFDNDIESDVRSMEKDHEKHRIEQRFLEMNRQIGKLTSIVRALTDKRTNSREENGRDILNSVTSTRSDTNFEFFIEISSCQWLTLHLEAVSPENGCFLTGISFGLGHNQRKISFMIKYVDQQAICRS